MNDSKVSTDEYLDNIASYVEYLAKTAKNTASIFDGIADTIKSRRFVTAKMLKTIKVQQEMLKLAQKLNNKDWFIMEIF